jgi:hypothetical protein
MYELSDCVKTQRAEFVEMHERFGLARDVDDALHLATWSAAGLGTPAPAVATSWMAKRALSPGLGRSGGSGIGLPAGAVRVDAGADGGK